MEFELGNLSSPHHIHTEYFWEMLEARWSVKYALHL
jgi:hypothetical protein